VRSLIRFNLARMVVCGLVAMGSIIAVANATGHY
jgi:hypothetical protein